MDACLLFRSTQKCQPNKSGFEMSVRPSTKRFFDFNEIWHVGRGQRVMHDGMQCDPIQGHCHEPMKIGNLSIFKSYLHHL